MTIKKCRKIGVMQGRLLPKYKGRYQAHPVGTWAEEFRIASDLELSQIEFIFDYEDVGLNPLSSPSGIEQIRNISRQSEVKVETVCADYFMEAPIHSTDQTTSSKSLSMLELLIKNCHELGASEIVMPCVDHASLNSKDATSRLVDGLQKIEELLNLYRMKISLETDLGPQEFANLLERISIERVTVNYDIGNSAALGFDPEEEFAAYGQLITDVHIKDRIKGGGPVELGTGDADIKKVISLLNEKKYTGPFIMQAYRDDEGVEIFRRQLRFFLDLLDQDLETENL